MRARAPDGGPTRTQNSNFRVAGSIGLSSGRVYQSVSASHRLPISCPARAHCPTGVGQGCHAFEHRGASTRPVSRLVLCVAHPAGMVKPRQFSTINKKHLTAHCFYFFSCWLFRGQFTYLGRNPPTEQGISRQVPCRQHDPLTERVVLAASPAASMPRG